MHTTELAVSPVASAISLLGDLSTADREQVLAAFPSSGGGVPSPMAALFDAAHPPAGWRSIADVPPIEALAPVFAAPSWLKQYQRGADLQAYSATCSGLKQLSLDLGRKVAKIGTCEVGRLEGRLQGLGWQEYGSVRRDRHTHVKEPGFSSYQFMDRLKIATQPPGCPVRNTPYGFVVTMPRGMRQRQHDLRLNLALRPFRLTTFADSTEGRATCAARAVPVERLLRSYGCGHAVLQSADEFLVVDPFKDGCRLATVMAVVVLQHVAPDLVPADLRGLVPLVGEAANDPALGCPRSARRRSARRVGNPQTAGPCRRSRRGTIPFRTHRPTMSLPA